MASMRKVTRSTDKDKKMTPVQMRNALEKAENTLETGCRCAMCKK